MFADDPCNTLLMHVMAMFFLRAVTITINKQTIARVSHIKLLVLLWIKPKLGHNILKRLLQKFKIYISISKN